MVMELLNSIMIGNLLTNTAKESLTLPYLVKANNSTQNWIITSGTDVGMNVLIDR